jgi:formylglycine-generating enzyme required for sulfatase activity
VRGNEADNGWCDFTFIGPAGNARQIGIFDASVERGYLVLAVTAKMQPLIMTIGHFTTHSAYAFDSPLILNLRLQMRVFWTAFAVFLCWSAAARAEANLPIATTDPSELAPLDLFQECDACPEMIVLPLGSFTMGGPPGESRRNIHWDAGNIRPVTAEDPYIAYQEGPLHTVTIDLRIAMGRNEITLGEWKSCVADGGCGGYMPPDHVLTAIQGQSPTRFDLSDRHPVIGVSYDDMQLYLDWLNTKAGTNVYRLPTEAEWEYAARAGTQTPFAQGEDLTSDQANFNGIATGEMLGMDRPDLLTRGHPVAVDELDAANPWGLRHMSGNVIERTMSCWTNLHTEWPTSSIYFEMAKVENCQRVTRGGTFAVGMDDVRVAIRGRVLQDRRSNISGFRITRDLEQSGENE